MVGGREAPGASTAREPTRPVAGSFVSVVVGIPVPVALTVPFPTLWARRSISDPAAAVREKLVLSTVSGVGPAAVEVLPMTVKRSVWIVLRLRPPAFGPSRRAILFPNGLPVILCGVWPSPMKPAGGAGAVASHFRNGPTLVDGRTTPKSQAGGATVQPWSSVKLIVPSAAATNVFTPNG